MYASLITAPLTVGFGGSVGLQGPAINTGAAIASNIAQFFHTSARNRNLLIGCASAGAVASMFKAPIAGVIFAVEIFSLDLAFASMIPLLLASVSAVITSYLFLGSEVLPKLAYLTNKLRSCSRPHLQLDAAIPLLCSLAPQHVNMRFFLTGLSSFIKLYFYPLTF